MNWSRLGGAVPDALLISFAVGAVLAPPDPFTQVLYAGPAFLLALGTVYRYGDRSLTPWWRRYLVFLGGLVAVSLAWGALAAAVGAGVEATLRPAFLLAGLLAAAWLAYFGGAKRLRGREASEA